MKYKKEQILKSRNDNNPANANVTAVCKKIDVANIPSTSNLNAENTPSTSNLSAENTPSTSNLTAENTPLTSNLEAENTPSTSKWNAENKPSTSKWNAENKPSTSKWNAESISMNNITHVYPTSTVTVVAPQQTQTSTSCIFSNPQYTDQTHAPETAVYCAEQGRAAQNSLPDQCLYQTYSYEMYSGQSQCASQIEYSQTLNADNTQQSSYMNSDSNKYECPHNMDDNVQEKQTAMSEMNNFTYTTTQDVSNIVEATLTMEDIIRGSLMDLTDLIDL
jgi:hypothetical protein